MNPVAVSFIFFLLLFVVIGAYSARHSKSTIDDYLLAGRSIGPWFTALSAVASNSSGFMFIGLIGTTYTMGISAVWIMFGFIFGDYVMWFWVHRRLRERSEDLDARTIPAFLAAGLPRYGRSVRSVAALITLAFLGTYASAQFSAGSKALHVIFGWDYSAGAIVGAVIVLIYCYAGGIRASIWTDVAQSIIMIVSMVLLCVVALYRVGGWAALWSQLAAIDPQLINPFPRDPRFGVLLYILGWLGGGIGVVGQPHIMVRAMACRSAREIYTARHIYLIWYLIFTVGCYGVALACRVLLPDSGSFDAELALPMLALKLLPGVLVGLILAGLFSATMSTADSQLLSCSAALTQDLFPRWQYSYRAAKVGTVAVAAVVLALALGGNQNVFTLVTMSWSALAAGLGPLLVIRALRLPIGAVSALAVMGSGLLTVFVWRYGLGYSDDVFEVLPGVIVGVLVYLVLRPTERTAAGQGIEESISQAPRVRRG